MTLLCAVALVSACSDDDAPLHIIEPEYVVFGQYSGGESSEEFNMYRVTRTEMEREALALPFALLDYDFEADEAMSPGDLSNAQQVIDLIPDVLLQTETTTFGCPDCHDQGGYYLEYGDGTRSHKLLIDIEDTDDQPEELVQFKNALATLIVLFDN